MFSMPWCSISSIFCTPYSGVRSKEQCTGFLQPKLEDSYMKISQCQTPSINCQCHEICSDNCEKCETSRNSISLPSYKPGRRVTIVGPALTFLKCAPDVTIRVMEIRHRNSVTFLPSQPFLPISDERKLKFSATSVCHHSPLVRRLLRLNGISGVTLAADHVKVKKDAEDGVTWRDLKPSILSILLDFFASNLPALTDHLSALPHHHDQQGECVCPRRDDETEAVIDDLINTRIRPSVQDEGGDVIFKTFDRTTGSAYIILLGTCLSSLETSRTIKRLILSLLQFYVPSVRRVLQVENPDLAKSWSSYF